MTPYEISDLVARAVQRAMEKRPAAEPSRDASYPEGARGRTQERAAREGHDERRTEGSLEREGESDQPLLRDRKGAMKNSLNRWLTYKRNFEKYAGIWGKPQGKLKEYLTRKILLMKISQLLSNH